MGILSIRRTLHPASAASMAAASPAKPEPTTSTSTSSSQVISPVLASDSLWALPDGAQPASALVPKMAAPAIPAVLRKSLLPIIPSIVTPFSRVIARSLLLQWGECRGAQVDLGSNEK